MGIFMMGIGSILVAGELAETKAAPANLANLDFNIIHENLFLGGNGRIL